VFKFVALVHIIKVSVHQETHRWLYNVTLDSRHKTIWPQVLDNCLNRTQIVSATRMTANTGKTAGC